MIIDIRYQVWFLFFFFLFQEKGGSLGQIILTEIKLAWDSHGADTSAFMRCSYLYILKRKHLDNIKLRIIVLCLFNLCVTFDDIYNRDCYHHVIVMITIHIFLWLLLIVISCKTSHAIHVSLHYGAKLCWPPWESLCLVGSFPSSWLIKTKYLALHISERILQLDTSHCCRHKHFQWIFNLLDGAF